MYRSFWSLVLEQTVILPAKWNHSGCSIKSFTEMFAFIKRNKNDAKFLALQKPLSYNVVSNQHRLSEFELTTLVVVCH
jgi:hypothetical protein